MFYYFIFTVTNLFNFCLTITSFHYYTATVVNILTVYFHACLVLKIVIYYIYAFYTIDDFYWGKSLLMTAVCF